MAVPETTMDEDCLSSSREHDVWFARQALGMQPITKSVRVQQSPDDPLGSRMTLAHGSHDPASLLSRARVSHSHTL